MKRLVSLLVALCLLMVAFSAVAEPARTLKVAYIPNSMSNESMAYSFKEMEKHAAEYNIEMTAFDGQFDPQVEARAVSDCIAQKYDAIIVTPSDINAIVPSLMEAKEAGIIIGLFAADLTDDYKQFRDFFCGVNDNSAGETAAEAFIAKFPEGAKVVEIGGQAGTDAQNKRHDGFTSVVQGSKLEVLDYQACSTGWATSEAMSITEDFITKYGKDIQGVFCHWDNGATGCAEALKNAGMEDVYVVAIDGCRAGFDQVKAGTQDVCISQSFLNMAVKSLECVRTLADGGQLETVENFIPLDVVTAENIDTFPYPEW